MKHVYPARVRRKRVAVARSLEDVGAADLIWSAGRGAWIAGPDTGPVLAPLAPRSLLVGARLLPGAGGPAFGVPLSELRDDRVDVVLLDRMLAEELAGDLSPAEAFRRVVAVSSRLTIRLASRRGDPRRGSSPRRARVDRLARDLGLSERQLRRRCDASVGYGPKTLQRTLRFRRFVARAGASGPHPELARLADRRRIRRPGAPHARVHPARRSHAVRATSVAPSLTPPGPGPLSR